MTNRVEGVVLSNATWAQAAVKQGIDKYIYQFGAMSAPVSDEKLASTVEAIIGPVWLDSGHDRIDVLRVMKAFGIQWPSMMYPSW